MIPGPCLPWTPPFPLTVAHPEGSQRGSRTADVTKLSLVLAAPAAGRAGGECGARTPDPWGTLAPPPPHKTGGGNRHPAKLSGLSEVTEMGFPKPPVDGPSVRWRAGPEAHDVGLELEGLPASLGSVLSGGVTLGRHLHVSEPQSAPVCGPGPPGQPRLPQSGVTEKCTE